MFEGVHPLEGGGFRLKFCCDRRSGMKIESPLVFYPCYAWETAKKAWRCWQVYRQLRATLNEALTAPDRVATAPAQQDEFERLSLYHKTIGGTAALVRKRRDDVIRAGSHASEAAPTATASE